VTKKNFVNSFQRQVELSLACQDPFPQALLPPVYASVLLIELESATRGVIPAAIIVAQLDCQYVCSTQTRIQACLRFKFSTHEAARMLAERYHYKRFYRAISTTVVSALTVDNSLIHAALEATLINSAADFAGASHKAMLRT